MSHKKPLTALLTLACASLLAFGTLVGAARGPRPERKFKVREFKDAPVVITEVRNLQNGHTWFRDLEIEIKNVSDSPIYFVSLVLEFPDIPAPPPQVRADGSKPSRTATAITLEYGDPRLVDVQVLATEQDLPLKPGQTHTLKVPQAYVAGLESMKKRMNLPPTATDRIEFEFHVVSFGNGVGYLGGRKWAYRTKAKRWKDAAEPGPQGVSYSKVGLTGGVVLTPPKFMAAKQANSACTGGCEKWHLKAVTPACVAPDNTTCNGFLVEAGNDGPCSTYTTTFFDCGEGVRCPRDVISQGSCAQPCADNDGDGYAAAPCGGDCNDSNASVNPNEFEICNNNLDDDCAWGADNSDPSCYHCAGVRQACADLRGAYFDPVECVCYYDSPVLIDVAGDGFALTDAARGVNFDLDGDGAAERLSWTLAGDDDAWLALDRDGDGRIANGRELFGNYTPQAASDAPNGFLALAEFDKAQNGGNDDGALDGRDAAFASLRLWRDLDHDGVSAPGELHTLPALKVASVRLDYKESRRRDRHGNVFRYRAQVTGASERDLGRWAYDVLLVRDR